VVSVGRIGLSVGGSWIGLIKANQSWSNQSKFAKAGLRWSKLAKAGQIKAGQISLQLV
jgi:hypothetical protein